MTILPVFSQAIPVKFNILLSWAPVRNCLWCYSVLKHLSFSRGGLPYQGLDKQTLHQYIPSNQIAELGENIEQVGPGTE